MSESAAKRCTCGDPECRDRIYDLAELREAAANDGVGITTTFIGGPGWNVVCALVAIADAAADVYRGMSDTPGVDPMEELGKRLSVFKFEEDDDADE